MTERKEAILDEEFEADTDTKEDDAGTGGGRCWSPVWNGSSL